MKPRTAMLGGGIVLLLVGALAGYLYGASSVPAKTSTTTTTTTTGSVPGAYAQVANAYTNRLLLYDARNPSALASGYEANATVEWTGISGGCDGNYTGLQNITQLLSGFLTPATYFLISNETQTIGQEGGSWLVLSTFNFSAQSNLLGTFEGTVASRDTYVPAGGAWLISNETWNFLYYDTAFIDAGVHITEC